MNCYNLRVSGGIVDAGTYATVCLGIGGSDKAVWAKVFGENFYIITSTAWNFETGTVTRASTSMTISDYDHISLER
jgi:hypothetical protein